LVCVSGGGTTAARDDRRAARGRLRLNGMGSLEAKVAEEKTTSSILGLKGPIRWVYFADSSEK